MANEAAIAVLLQKREQVIEERKQLLSKLDNEINELELAIERLSGKLIFWDLTTEELYDDLSPNYIKSSQEEM